MTKDSTAPGRLELVRQFVNSLDPDHPERDSFLTAEGALEWFAEHGPSGIAAISEADRLEMLTLREALLGELLAHTHKHMEESGSEEPGTAWPPLEDQLAGTQLSLAIEPDGSYFLAPAGNSAIGILRGMIGAAVYEAIRSGEWRRLKACRKVTCLYAFYDRAKNGTGIWCDMAVCGNRVKAQRRRARDRERAGGISA